MHDGGRGSAADHMIRFEITNKPRLAPVHSLGAESDKNFVYLQWTPTLVAGIASDSIMARRNNGFRIVAALLVLIPLFTLVMIFGVEWSFVEKMSQDQASEQERSSESNRKRTMLSPNNRSPLDTEDQARRMIEVPIKPPLPGRYADESRAQPSLQKQAMADMNTSVFQSLLQQLPLSVRDRAKLYELLRERKVYELRTEKSMRELWWYIRDRVAKLDRGEKVAADTLVSVREQYNVMRWLFGELKGVSGMGGPIQLNWEYWQRNVSIEMARLMERRLDYLQNPPNCESAKKLVCEVAKTCGFGCQIHHVAYCFIMAYATKRTLIIDSRNWRYSANGWDVVFQPVSSTCTSFSGELH